MHLCMALLLMVWARSAGYAVRLHGLVCLGSGEQPFRANVVRDPVHIRGKPSLGMGLLRGHRGLCASCLRCATARTLGASAARVVRR
jgi:hypothetical protein